MQNPAFWGILGSENRQLLTGTNPEGTARDDGCVGKGGEWRKGFCLPNRLRSLVERRELSQRGPRRSPGRKRISVLSERHRMYLVEMSVVN